MTFITRAQWGARPPKTPFTTVPISARTATCVHHDGSAPVIVRTFAEACARVRADEAYHMDHNGWAGIGYNYLCISAPGTDVDGLIFEGRGRDVVGAHCLGWNTPWIGVQVAIGGDQTPSPLALASTRWLHDSFVADAGHPLGMKGHQDGYPTACPGVLLQAWVRAGMPVQSRPTPRKPLPPTVARWQGLLAFAPGRRDGVWGDVTEQRSAWLVTAALHKSGTLAGSADTTIRLIQRVIGAAPDGNWGPRSRLAMTLWTKRAQVFLGVVPTGAWDATTQAAYAKFRTAHHH